MDLSTCSCSSSPSLPLLRPLSRTAIKATIASLSAAADCDAVALVRAAAELSIEHTHTHANTCTYKSYTF